MLLCLGRPLKLVVMAFCLLLISHIAFANNGEDVLRLYNADHYSVSEYLYVLEDIDNKLTIDEVVSAYENGDFERNQQNILNYGFVDHTFWVAFKVAYPDGEPNIERKKSWYLEFAVPLLSEGELYEFDGSKWSSRISDLRIPYKDRELDHVYSIFPVEFQLGESKLLIAKMRTMSSLIVPVNFWDKDEYAKKLAVEEFIFGLFYGAVLCIIAFNFFIYLSVKESSYLYYICYLISVGLLLFIDLGHGVNLLDSEGFLLNKDNLPIIICFLWISVAQFIRAFLDTRKTHAITDEFLKIMVFVSILSIAITTTTPNSVSLVWFAGLTPMLIIILVPLCISIWRRGNPNALYFLIAWSFNLLGASAYSVISLGLLPATPFILVLSPAGILVEAILLSLALANHMKRVQKALEESDQRAMSQLYRYQSAFDNALEGIYQLSLDGKFIRVNPSMARMLGYINPQSVISAGDNAVALCFHSPETQYRELAQNRLLKEEVSFICDDGHTAWADHTARLIYDAEGQPSHIEGSFVDLTERKKHEAALRAKEKAIVENNMAKETAAAKSQFLAKMSHEIRTPLTSIIGHSEAVKSLNLSGSERENAFRTIMHSSHKLLQLINNILDYSKIEAKKLELEKVELDLVQLLEELKENYEWQANQKGLKLLLLYEFPFPKKVITDQARLKQILDSLLSNAVKFTAEGHVKLVVSWNEQTEQLNFNVVDTGIGIAKDDQKGLFDVFKQSQLDSVRKYGNTGMGLAISKQLALLMGGDVTFTTTQGVGSEFRLYFYPEINVNAGWFQSNDDIAVVSPSRSKQATQPVSMPNLEGKTVLLAEDNPVNQKLISRLIGKTGVNVIVAENGQVAVDRVLQGGVDLVFMDINMPVKNGLEATAEIRKKAISVPIFALTAEIDKRELGKALDAGCEQCLKKPIDKNQLYEVLTNALKPSKSSK